MLERVMVTAQEILDCGGSLLARRAVLARITLDVMEQERRLAELYARYEAMVRAIEKETGSALLDPNLLPGYTISVSGGAHN